MGAHLRAVFSSIGAHLCNYLQALNLSAHTVLCSEKEIQNLEMLFLQFLAVLCAVT